MHGYHRMVWVGRGPGRSSGPKPPPWAGMCMALHTWIIWMCPSGFVCVPPHWRVCTSSHLCFLFYLLYYPPPPAAPWVTIYSPLCFIKMQFRFSPTFHVLQPWNKYLKIQKTQECKEPFRYFLLSEEASADRAVQQSRAVTCDLKQLLMLQIILDIDIIMLG